MAVTIEAFREYVGTSEDSTFVDDCLAAGLAMVEKIVGDSEVPAEVVDNATLVTASEIFHRRSSPQGVTQFAAMDGGSPIRVAKNPRSVAYEYLFPWLSPAV